MEEHIELIKKTGFPGTKVILALLILFCSWTSLAHAAFITIDTEVSVRTGDDRLIVHVKLTNKGDEPAYNLVVRSRR